MPKLLNNFCLIILKVVMIFSGCTEQTPYFYNSIGMKMILIPKGSFMMGESDNIPVDDFDVDLYLQNGDWDEKPVHQVTISSSFYISETEVTIEQYKKYRSDYLGIYDFDPYVAGINWYDAEKFCQWLSEKESKNYRLPTEAEWEYVCRAGTNSLFYTGKILVDSLSSNSWGIKNMHDGVAEWCLDWHGRYTNESQVDPVGPSNGLVKIIRGGGLDQWKPYYLRSANRAGMPPDFPPERWLSVKSKIIKDQRIDISKDRDSVKPGDFKSRFAYQDFIRDKLNNQGNHTIGFRVVQAPYPETEPSAEMRSFATECIKQNTENVTIGPDSDLPYFRKRYLLPTPPENTFGGALDDIKGLGFHPAFLGHHHSPGLEVCSNGDVLAIYYTSDSETSPDVALIASRLRFGADQWDMPDLFLDFPDANDHAPMLWKDGDKLYFFWGNNKLSSGFPFQYITSIDNGQSWSLVNFPVFETLVGGHSAQPITSAFRDHQGTMYVGSDGVGPESVLWVSKNNGETWMDTGGRTGGRHTTFVLLNDDRILGMGGKSSDINGFMPQSLSSNGGKTWTISKTVFPALGSNQRPTIIRLQSGRLFFAGDLQHRNGSQPMGYSDRGAYVAISDDEGKKWHIKKLPGAQEHESEDRRKDLKGATLGYAIARQAANGIIHLITSMNEPCLHFAFNEAWILGDDAITKSDEELLSSNVSEIRNVREYKEYYPDKSIRANWQAGVGNDGRYLLHGQEVFYYPDGSVHWQANYELGEKVGEEFYFMPGEKLTWSWDHKKEGESKWMHWWNHDQIKSQSTWINKKCEGVAKFWDNKGNSIKEVLFENGIPIN